MSIKENLAARRPGTTKLTEANVLEIKRQYRDGFMPDEISLSFPVVADTIREIVRGARWGHILLPDEG